MAEVSIDRKDIDQLAQKLDNLGENLNDEEKTLLLAVFRLGGEAITGQAEDVADVFRGEKAGALTLNREGQLPSLSSGFKDAFTAGRAGRGEEFTSKISVDGSVSVMGTTSAF